MFEVSWIKLTTSIFSNHKMQILLRHEHGAKFFVFWIYLLTFAGIINDNGKIYLTKDIALNNDDFAATLGFEPFIISLALEFFERYCMISIDKKGIISILNWEKYQNVDRLAELREYNRLAKQRERERKKNSVNDESLTSQPRKEKKRKEKKNFPVAPSKYSHLEEELIMKNEVDNE